MENQSRVLLASIEKLATTDVNDVDSLLKITNSMRKASVEIVASNPAPTEAASQKTDMKLLGDQVTKLHAAAIIPAKNYRKIAAITSKLQDLVKVASLPQNAAIRPNVESVVKRCAGIFAEIDTVEDLDKPLDQIEKAVNKLYGDQGKNSTYYFDRRGKGNHS